MTKGGPIQGRARAVFSRHPRTYSRLKQRLAMESPWREALSPRIPSNEAEIHAITLWHFWRAPPRPPANPYRTGHGLPLEFPASSSPEIVETRPSRVVRRSHPTSLPKGRVRVIRLKTGRTLIDHTHARLGGLPAISKPRRKRTKRTTGART
jgi:hypothetical protein